MQKTLSESQIEAFYHDNFVRSQVNDFRALVKIDSRNIVVDVGGGCGFFAESLARQTGLAVRVIDTDHTSVETCRTKGIDAEINDALDPRLRGDEHTICFNLVLHHLVGSNEANTLELQRKALNVWQGRVESIFVNEYIYDSYISSLSGRIIYEITSSRFLSAAASIVSRWIPSLRANTFGVGVRFRSRKEWIRVFTSSGWRVAGEVRGAEEGVSIARRALLIRSCRRDSFLLTKS